ncbi:MAG: ATP-binding cassette domain-containing protein [Candidatus Nanopelagicales bacterium]
MREDLAISVEAVSQRFSLHHEKSLKGFVVQSLRRRHKVRETFLALDDVSIEIPTGSTMGLIGHNGSGKSTLLKAIGGVITPTSGRVTRRGRLTALLELKAGFDGDLTGRENVELNARLMGLSKADTRARFDDIVDFSGVANFIDTPMKYYSSGMFVRLGFALAIHTDPDVLLIDEVLAVGDEKFQARCLDAMRTFQSEGRTIVLVSHSMRDIQGFCDSVTLLHEGRVRSQGNVAEGIREYRRLLEESQTLRQESAGPVGEESTGGSVRITHARAWAESGTPLDQFQRGDTVVVEATFAPVVPTERYVGRLQLFGTGNLLLHGTSTQRLGLGTGPLTEPVTVRFTLPDLDLAGGRYRIALETASEPSARPWHRLGDVARIHVRSDERWIGPMYVPSSGAVVGSEALDGPTSST